MRARRIPWIVVCLVAALALAVAMSGGSAVASPRAAADQEYADPVGDAGVGTDIATVTVRNDPTSGGITIQIQSASPIVGNHAVAVFIDADRNQSTGDDGDEYWFYGGPMVGSGFFAWNGSAFAEANPPSFWAGRAAANVNEFRINRADIGNVSGFNFSVVSIGFEPPSIRFWDAAPNSGYWSYDLATPPPPPPPPPVVVAPQIGAPLTVPMRAVAGKRMTVVFPVTRSDTGKPLTTGKMVCDPSVAGKVLPHAESFKAGRATLSFVIPKAAKGKQLRVKVTINVGAQSATRIAAFRVK